jgi:predicted amidohydrolase
MTNIAGPPYPPDKHPDSLSEEDAIGVGRTCICAPFSGCVGRVESGDEALLLAALDLRVLQDARDIYRVRYDLRNAWSAEQANVH